MDRTEVALIQLEWSQLVEQAKQEAQVCVELDHRNWRRTEDKAEALRRYWAAASKVLRRYTEIKARHNFDPQPFPWEVLTSLAEMSEDLSNGRISDAIKDVAQKGRRYWRAERRNIADALHYLEAVDGGLIDDKSPVETICRAFNVTRKAVRFWRKRRDHICEGFSVEGLEPSEIEGRMRESGRRYTAHGRGDPRSERN